MDRFLFCIRCCAIVSSCADQMQKSEMKNKSQIRIEYCWLVVFVSRFYVSQCESYSKSTATPPKQFGCDAPEAKKVCET